MVVIKIPYFSGLCIFYPECLPGFFGIRITTECWYAYATFEFLCHGPYPLLERFYELENEKHRSIWVSIQVVVLHTYKYTNIEKDERL